MAENGKRAARPFRLAIFDLDGTLLDTREGLTSSVQYATDAFSLPRVDAAAMRTFIGPPMQLSLHRYYGLDEVKCREIANVFRTHYKDVDLCKAVPYPGIYETLSALLKRGVRIAVATYKREDYAERILAHFGFDRYADIRHGADFDGKRSKCDIIRLCVAESGVPDTEAVMIGDSESDSDGARAAGVAFIGVTYGFGFVNGDEVRLAGGEPSDSAPGILDYFG